MYLNNIVGFKICELDRCTGCGACVYGCPKQCITIEKNEKGENFPRINFSKCIGCQKCRKICPENERIYLYPAQKAYVGWSKNPQYRYRAASGGIASSLYQYFSDTGKMFVGTYLNNKFIAQLKVGHTVDDIEIFRGSKYVFSELYTLYDEMKQMLVNGRSILFVGLPCQVAAIKKIFGEKNIIYVDLICHGVCSSNYLKEHIQNISKKNITKIEFRDPEYGTQNFVFSIFSNGKRIYKRGVDLNDVYQLAYHKSIDYRENCYKCSYAQSKRGGDITLGDYWGIGEKYPYFGEKENISLILINTEKGKSLLNELVLNNYIGIIERPLKEALSTEKQLIEPSTPPKERDIFLEEMKKNGNAFVKSSKRTLRKKIVLNYLIPVKIRRIIYRKIKQINSKDKLYTKGDQL